jgi:3-oxoacyl-[acyl-carrier-protein] synthase II
MKRQPVITGVGIVSPIGIGIDKFWAAALAGRSGIGRPTLFDASKLPTDCQIVGEVRDFNPLEWMPVRAVKMAARFSQFAVASAKMARADSGLDTAGIPHERVKVAIGTSLNGHIDVAQPNYEAFLRGNQVWPWAALEYPAHAATAHVAIDARAAGQTTTFATACAAGLDAVAWAADQIRYGYASAVLAGATETPLSEFMMRIFSSVGVLSKWPGPPEQASRPFDM